MIEFIGFPIAGLIMICCYRLARSVAFKQAKPRGVINMIRIGENVWYVGN